jgi:hypothetical protein
VSTKARGIVVCEARMHEDMAPRKSPQHTGTYTCAATDSTAGLEALMPMMPNTQRLGSVRWFWRPEKPMCSGVVVAPLRPAQCWWCLELVNVSVQ